MQREDIRPTVSLFWEEAINHNISVINYNGSVTSECAPPPNPPSPIKYKPGLVKLGLLLWLPSPNQWL